MRKIDKKIASWGIVAVLVICSCASFIYLLFNNEKVVNGFARLFVILTPILDGIILAYLLTPIMNFLEKNIVIKLFSKLKIKDTPKKNKRIRAVSICLTLLFVVLLIGLFFRLIIPQLVLSIQSIIFQFPMYVNNLYLWVNNLLVKNPELEDIFNQVYTHYSSNLTQFLQEDILPRVNALVRTLSLSVFGLVKSLWNFVIGFIISIYMLSSKEVFCRQAREITYACFEKLKAKAIISNIHFMHETFIGFLGGKIIDSLIIGIICFICTSIIGTPYGVLISCIVGVTNVIPFFGPYIGAIPSALLVLMVNPRHCLYFIILILIIQQVDGNIIGPKILGNSTGLSSFWVIFSITLFGGLFGIAGMILGVPIFAVIYAGIKYWVHDKLSQKELKEMSSSDREDKDFQNNDEPSIRALIDHQTDESDTVDGNIIEEEES